MSPVSKPDNDAESVAKPNSPEKKSGQASRKTTAASLRIEGLAETLHDVRHELNLISNASKYNWINQRLILLRNALIAFGVLVIVVVAVVACYREAYRQTLTIAAFDVPEKLAERGITGQVIAKALFDELIKRRELVTTLVRRTQRCLGGKPRRCGDSGSEVHAAIGVSLFTLHDGQ